MDGSSEEKVDSYNTECKPRKTMRYRKTMEFSVLESKDHGVIHHEFKVVMGESSAEKKSLSLVCTEGKPNKEKKLAKEVNIEV